jgi:hypothetical protein
VPYVLGPIVVFSTLRFRIPPTIVVVDPREYPLPESARAYFAEAFQSLTANGFELIGTMGLPDLTPNAQTLFALYANRTTEDMAMSAVIVGQSGVGPELRTNYVEFVRRFDDGVVVQTNNSHELSAFKRLPDEYTTKFWEIRDIARLYQLHRLLADRFRQRGRPVLQLFTNFGGNAIQYLSQAVLEETFRSQVTTGYLAETGGGFRPTVKGSLLMTWQELWPAKGIRRAREKQRAESLLAELEPRLMSLR